MGVGALRAAVEPCHWCRRVVQGRPGVLFHVGRALLAECLLRRELALDWDLGWLLQLGCHCLGRLLLELLDLLHRKLLLAVVGGLLGVVVGLSGHILLLRWRVLAGVDHLRLSRSAEV